MVANEISTKFWVNVASPSWSPHSRYCLLSVGLGLGILGAPLTPARGLGM